MMDQLWLTLVKTTCEVTGCRPIRFQTTRSRFVLNRRPLDQRVGILVNEHSTSAAEMLAQFAKENNLATIIGTKTPGRLTSRSAFKIGHDYRLVLPIAAYQSWKGVRIEGKGIEPDVEVNWSFEDAVAGRDRQLDYAFSVVQAL